MFSAKVFLAKHDFSPKNGPVPSQPVNGYRKIDTLCKLYIMHYVFRGIVYCDSSFLISNGTQAETNLEMIGK
jgi:hypothetical protein